MYVSMTWQPGNSDAERTVASTTKLRRNALADSGKGVRSVGITAATCLCICRGNGYYSCGAMPRPAPRAVDHPNVFAAMTSPEDLKSAGLKATVPRLKIINLFETSQVRHMTAED